MRIVIAIDKFAWHRTAPEDEVLCVPMADGGPGFLDAMTMAWAGRGGEPTGFEELATVTGPLGAEVTARYLVDPADGGTGYVEVAEACGLHLIPAEERDAKAATSYGVGQLIDAVIGQGVRRVVIGLPGSVDPAGLGGTCTTDGGAAMLAALGAEPGDVLRRGGGALKELDRLDLSAARERVAGVEIVIASDVDNPLLGLRGAAAVFGPQKGATDDDVQRLDAALTRFAQLAGAIGQEPGALRRTLDAPGAGAGGGLGYGLMLLGG